MGNHLPKQRKWQKQEKKLKFEVEAKKFFVFYFLFGTLADIKKMEWWHVMESVNVVASVNQLSQKKRKEEKKTKVEVKQRAAEHQQSMSRTGGGSGADELTPCAPCLQDWSRRPY